MASFKADVGGDIKQDDVSQASSCCKRQQDGQSGQENRSSSVHNDGNLVATSLGPASIPLVELAVNVSDQDDLLKLDEALRRKGVEMVATNLEDKTIQVQFPDHRLQQKRPDSTTNMAVHTQQDANIATATAFDVASLQEYIERETGFLAVIKGMGQLTSAVAELKPSLKSNECHPEMFGVVRLSQMDDGACFVDGLINKTATKDINPKDFEHQLAEGRRQYSLAIHEFGDLSSDTFDSIGTQDIQLGAKEQQAGEPLGAISIQQVVAQCNVVEQIGKSIALSLIAKECDKTVILSAGVIARASTIDANKKQICTCSGKTIWQERAERSKS